MMQASKERIAWIDGVKAIGIALVVFGHGYGCWLTRWLYTFHLPLFFFASGLTYRQRGRFSEFLRDRGRRLLLPYALYAPVRLMWLLLVDIVRGDGLGRAGGYVLNIFLNVRNTPSSIGLWFLPLLFLSEAAMFWTLRLLRRTWSRRLLMAALLAGGFAYARFVGRPLPWGMDAALVAAPFLFAGWRLRPFLDGVSGPRHGWLLALGANLLLGGANLWLSGDSVDMYFGRYGHPLLFWAAALSGILAVCLLARRLPPRRALNLIGQNTLDIYCVHQIALEAMAFVLYRLSGGGFPAGEAARALTSAAMAAVALGTGLAWALLRKKLLERGWELWTRTGG